MPQLRDLEDRMPEHTQESSAGLDEDQIKRRALEFRQKYGTQDKAEPGIEEIGPNEENTKDIAMQAALLPVGGPLLGEAGEAGAIGRNIFSKMASKGVPAVEEKAATLAYGKTPSSVIRSMQEEMSNLSRRGEWQKAKEMLNKIRELRENQTVNYIPPRK